MNPQTALSTPRSRPESPRRLRWRLLALSLTPVLVAGLGATALAEPAESTVSRLQLAVDDAVQLAPGLTLREFTASGPIRGAVLAADLTEATLEPTYLYSGAVADSAPVSDHLASAGAVAGVNGDFFDIGNTDAPLGVGVDGGQPVNGPADGWNDAMTVAGDAAQLDRVLLDGVVTTPSGDVTATNLNSPDVADSGVGVYTSAWGEADRAGVVDGAGSVVEIEVTDG
ncbi:MAG: hypothetical protein ACRDXX_11925, partial [Stackebrandtia sp.]